MEGHYETLGLSPTADDRTVRRTYRRLSKEHHPDQGGSRAEFLRIQDAYEAIVGEQAPDVTDPARRTPTYAPDDEEFEPGHESLTVDGDDLRLTLSGLVQHVSLERLVEDEIIASTDRTIAFFRVQNTGDRPLSWEGTAKTSFIGDDGFLYQGSNIVTPHADRLPERWCGTDVAIEPGLALDAVVIAEEIPDDVTVEKVMYTHRTVDETGDGAHSGGETERYLFELRPLVRERLDRLPYRR
ncbi:J domain-containing protein [Natronolimnohabitans innermongolicus]|nr:J domain-containing protein [Natronolimnohabitans innermongolicus]